MKITIAKYIHIGTQKQNEDCCLISNEKGRVFVAVSDGLGGHGMGDIASQTVCQVASEQASSCPSWSNQMFGELFLQCQNKVEEKQKAMNARGQMRATLNVLCVEQGYVYWSHVGDTRTYYFEHGDLVKRTFDHSIPQMMVALGTLEESQIRFHEERNRLMRAIGVENKKPRYETESPIALVGGQQFLMCTDGFWEWIDEQEMLACLKKSKTAKEWLENMVGVVQNHGKHQEMDNRTAVTIWIEGD